MLDFQALMSGAAIPTVDATDLKRFWTFMATEGKKHGPFVGFDIKVVSPLVSQGADIVAIFARSCMITALVKMGGIEQWADGDAIRDIVFQLASTFPLLNGIEQFDPDELQARLREASE